MESPVLEEGSGSVSLTCISESNPPAQVMWSKVGENSSPQYKEMLELNPVTRQHAGTYICQAENSVGRSDEERADVDILCKLIYTKCVTKYLILSSCTQHPEYRPLVSAVSDG